MSKKFDTTHRTILNAAWRRLARGDPARLEDVAVDAGVTRQALYQHFPSRGRLLIALVEHMDGELGLGALLAEAHATTDLEERLLGELRVSARFAPKIHGVAMSLVRLADTDADVARAFADRMRQRRAGLRRALTALAAGGRLKAPWTIATATDALYAASAPASVDVLLRELRWSPAALERWLVHLGRSMLSGPRRRARAR